MRKTLLLTLLCALACLNSAAQRVMGYDDINPNKCYTITTTTRGGITIDEFKERLCGTREVYSQDDDMRNPCTEEGADRFAFVQKGGEWYLYNVMTQKYVDLSNRRGVLTDEASTPVRFMNAESDCVMLYYDNTHYVNLGGSNQITIDTWNQKDAGNSFLIDPAGDFEIPTDTTEVNLEGYSPNSVGDLNFSATQNAETGLWNINFSFDAPRTMLDYEWNEAPLPFITKITLERSAFNEYDWSVRQTLEAPTPGEHYTFDETDVQTGRYDYRIVVYLNEETDWSTVNTIVCGQIPALLTEEEFYNTVEDHTVTLHITTPTLNDQFEELTMPLTLMEVAKIDPNSMMFEPEVFITCDTVQAGQTYEIILEDMADGLQTFAVRFSTEAGTSDYAYTSAFIGEDLPGMVENVQAEVTETGIRVTWEAPSIGQNGGEIDASKLTYTIKRGTDEYDSNAVLLAENITELTFTDNSTFGEETMFVYIITAKNAGGEGYAAVSNAIVTGPASALPFYENFDVVADMYGNVAPEHSTWSKSTTGIFPAWQYSQEAYVNNAPINAHNGTGMLYAFYSTWGEQYQMDYLDSGHINCEGAGVPELSFWYYDTTGEGSSTYLSVYTSDDDKNWIEAWYVQLGKSKTEGWRQKTLKLSFLKNVPAGRIRFCAEAQGDQNMSVVIDEIALTASTEGLGTVIATPANERNYDLQGRLINERTTGIYLQNGRKMIRH